MMHGDYSSLYRPPKEERSVDKLERRYRELEQMNYGSALGIQKPQQNRSLSKNQKQGGHSSSIGQLPPIERNNIMVEDLEQPSQMKSEAKYDQAYSRSPLRDQMLAKDEEEVKPKRKLLTDQEKQNIITELIEKRKELFIQLNRLPIANVRKHHLDKKAEIEQDLDEIDVAIKMFQSKKPVFVSDENEFSH